MQERVVERRVEDATLAVGSALDFDSSEPIVPHGVGPAAHGLEIPPAVFGAQVHARVLDVDERNTDLHLQRPHARGVERQNRARLFAAGLARVVLECVGFPNAE